MASASLLARAGHFVLLAVSISLSVNTASVGLPDGIISRESFLQRFIFREDHNRSSVLPNKFLHNEKANQDAQKSLIVFQPDLSTSDNLTEKFISINLTNALSSEKLTRTKLRGWRKAERATYLIKISKDVERQINGAAKGRSRNYSTQIRNKYSVWHQIPEKPYKQEFSKLMSEQIIMAKAYASISRFRNLSDVATDLTEQIRRSQSVIEGLNNGEELNLSVFGQARAMGRVLFQAKKHLHDCKVFTRKLRAMIQSAKENLIAQKKKSMFLVQYANKAIREPLQCLSLQLTDDYYSLRNHEPAINGSKLEDNSLYHYAIFSDSVLATSVAVNSTVAHAANPKDHVFHIVTDKRNFASMRAWFIFHPPPLATVQVQNVEEFEWLNSSYSPVLRQKELGNLKTYYFAANHPGTVSIGDEQTKYRNPKYLALLNHLRFYMPELFPKLNKILFLDDDVVVQQDLTPLWSINLEGMVNGAVETCGKSFHRFDTYLNFSDRRIADNFNPNDCAWAFGMNILDLKEWKKKNVTGRYHYWQEQNQDRLLWKLGTLPAGLVSFYKLTYPLDRRWHLLGLGYNPQISPEDINSAGVLHYNGNYKPWSDLAITEYQKYWSQYVMPDNPHLSICGIKP